MASDYKLFWTDEAINNLESILSYLSDSWTLQVTENFKNKLSGQLNLIQQNPCPLYQTTLGISIKKEKNRNVDLAD